MAGSRRTDTKVNETLRLAGVRRRDMDRFDSAATGVCTLRG
jgi:hypothetical protein